MDLVEKLKLIGMYYKMNKDQYRSLTYLKAAKLIAKYKRYDLPGIGPSVKKDIREYESTGMITRLEKLIKESAEKFETIELFTKVYGIGPKLAEKLYANNYRTLDDLYTYPKLTDAQKIGIKYYNELQNRIDHDTISDFESHLNHNLFTFDIVGSYRRNLPTSGDIDILLLKDSMYTLVDFIDIIDDKYELYTLAEGKTKFMGVVVYNNIPMRIDIRCVSRREYPFALLYFTGSVELNIEMRNKARKYGYILNEYGIYPETTNKQYELNIKSEREIFDLLDMPYLEPSER